jgi:rod shape-determining protein MreD
VLHAALALVLVGLQAALLRHLGGGAFTLGLPVILLIHLALTTELVDGAVAAAAVGYVLDVASGGTKGLLTSLAVATFLAVRLIRVGVEVRGWAGFAALCGLAALGLSAAAVAITRSVAPPELRPGWALLPRMALAALLTALASPLLLWGLRRLDAALGEQASDLAP